MPCRAPQPSSIETTQLRIEDPAGSAAEASNCSVPVLGQRRDVAVGDPVDARHHVRIADIVEPRAENCDQDQSVMAAGILPSTELMSASKRAASSVAGAAAAMPVSRRSGASLRFDVVAGRLCARAFSDGTESEKALQVFALSRFRTGNASARFAWSWYDQCDPANSDEVALGLGPIGARSRRGAHNAASLSEALPLGGAASTRRANGTTSHRDRVPVFLKTL